MSQVSTPSQRPIGCAVELGRGEGDGGALKDSRGRCDRNRKDEDEAAIAVDGV